MGIWYGIPSIRTKICNIEFSEPRRECLFPPGALMNGKTKSGVEKGLTAIAVALAVYMVYASLYGPYKTTIVHLALGEGEHHDYQRRIVFHRSDSLRRS